MRKALFALGVLTAVVCSQADLIAHCQMPCGIYHDDMVFDQIDQYVETMYKGITIICDNKDSTPHDRNELVRWVVLKEKSSDEVANIITTYFLQQKTKPGEADTVKKLVSAHKLLFLLVQIKQDTSRKLVEQFADEWDTFKLMFHVEGYECQVELLKQRKREQLKQKKEAEATAADHSHDHDHDHDHNHDHDHDHTH